MMHQKILVQKKAVLEQLKSKAAVRDIENNKTVEVSLPSYIKCKWTHLSVGSCCREIGETLAHAISRDSPENQGCTSAERERMAKIFSANSHQKRPGPAA